MQSLHQLVSDLAQDVDQLFAVIASVVLRAHNFRSVPQLLDLLREHIEPRIRAKGEELCIGNLDSVRDFKSWLSPLGINMYNCWNTRLNVEAPHSFSFRKRQDLIRVPHVSAFSQRHCVLLSSVFDLACVWFLLFLVLFRTCQHCGPQVPQTMCFAASNKTCGTLRCSKIRCWCSRATS